MRVTKDGEFFRGIHISGPTHNILRMRVQSTLNDKFEVTVLPPVSGCFHDDPIDAKEARDWISLGVERANNELGTSYSITEAEVVANDSRRPQVYAELARMIILAAHQEVAA